MVDHKVPLTAIVGPVDLAPKLIRLYYGAACQIGIST